MGLSRCRVSAMLSISRIFSVFEQKGLEFTGQPNVAGERPSIGWNLTAASRHCEQPFPRFDDLVSNLPKFWRRSRDMKLFSAHIEDLRSLYLSDLKKALDMERKITEALPDLIENARDEELATAFSNHLEETKGHVERVEALLVSHTGESETETCKVIDGLITEASDTIKDVTDVYVRDISLVGAAQQVEHHEIAVYGTLRRWAELLGLSSDATVLESIEADEINADGLLSSISERVNLIAAV